jgi:hypothetical protein
MTLSAAVLAALGVAASFLPQEILSLDALPPEPFTVVLVQICGALYVGFAALNWTAKGTLLGGVYGRPIVLANFAHFMIGGIAFAKAVLAGSPSTVILALTAVYTVFAIWFAYLLFGPGPAKG